MSGVRVSDPWFLLNVMSTEVRLEESCSGDTRPYTPRTNGKAERFIRTLLEEWAYGMAFQTSDERNQWLLRYLGIYNGVTWPWAVPRHGSSSSSSRSLNDLVRMHT